MCSLLQGRGTVDLSMPLHDAHRKTRSHLFLFPRSSRQAWRSLTRTFTLLMVPCGRCGCHKHTRVPTYIPPHVSLTDRKLNQKTTRGLMTADDDKVYHKPQDLWSEGSLSGWTLNIEDVKLDSHLSVPPISPLFKRQVLTRVILFKLWQK